MSNEEPWLIPPSVEVTFNEVNWIASLIGKSLCVISREFSDSQRVRCKKVSVLKRSMHEQKKIFRTLQIRQSWTSTLFCYTLIEIVLSLSFPLVLQVCGSYLVCFSCPYNFYRVITQQNLCCISKFVMKHTTNWIEHQIDPDLVMVIRSVFVLIPLKLNT
jgi:hypothetical protein